VKKKWSAWLRAWHWLNAVSVLFLGASGFLIMQGAELEEFAVRPHVLVGFVFTALVMLRFARMSMGDTRTISEAKHYATQALSILKNKRFPKGRAEFHVFHKAAIK
jgi:cytochrome b561